MATASAPFKFARIASLILSSVFGIVGLALGVDALVKGNHEKERIQSLVPRGTTVDIDTHDVVTVGAVVSAFSAALGVVSLASLALLLAALVTAKSGPTPASRTLPLQGVLLSILTLGLFGALVPMTNYVANREAKVTAKIGRLTLPPSVVQSVQDAIGATSVYHEISYLRVAVVLPWIAFLFGLTSSVLTLLAATRTRGSDMPVSEDTASDSTGAQLANEKDKKGNVSVAQTAV